MLSTSCEGRNVKGAITTSILISIVAMYRFKQKPEYNKKSPRRKDK
jgi:hypothetical protein